MEKEGGKSNESLCLPGYGQVKVCVEFFLLASPDPHYALLHPDLRHRT